MYVVVEDARDGLTLVEPRLRETWLCRLRAARLDRELADGLAPERDRSRGLWACLLVTPRERRLTARSLQRLIDAADEPGTSRTPMLTPAQRRVIRTARDPLHRLVERLQAPRPVAAVGMAKVRVLLSDGGGPLHCPTSARALEQALDEAATALEAPLLHD